MARYVYQKHVHDGNGKVISSGTVSVYLAGTTTPASIYAAVSGGTAVNSVTTDSTGLFTFYVDTGDYGATQNFKIVFSKANYQTQTYDNVMIFKEIGLGTMSLQNANNVSVSGGSITGITDLAVADGGTGASDAATARTNLGLSTTANQSDSTDKRFCSDAQKTVIGNTSGTNSGDQTITLTSDVTGSGAGSLAATIANSAVTYAKIQNVSATDKVLGRVTAGAGAVEEIACTTAGRALIDDADAATQRSTLGLGTIATQASDNVSITGGSVIGQTGIKIGTANTPSNKDTTVPIFVVGGNSVAATAQIVRHTNPGSGGAIFKLSATRGADVNSYTIVNSNDGLGQISFSGADGDEFVTAATIFAAVDGTPGDNDMPGRLIFATTADGDSSPTERMRIDSSGIVHILVGARITARVQSVTDAATVTPDADANDAVDITAIAQAFTIANPTGTPTNFQKLIIRIKDNATARAITWGNGYVAGGVALPSTTVLSKITNIGLIYNTANSLNKWQCVAVSQEA